MSDTARLSGGAVAAREFASATLAARVYLAIVLAAALALPFALPTITVPGSVPPPALTAAMLVAFSILNVEIGRVLAGGLARTHQPHKALSAWAFASALLLPAPWLLVIVTSTYAHARWRGLRIPLWKWVGSAAFLVVSGVAAGTVAHAVSADPHLTRGDGGPGLVGVVVAAAVFLAVESALFAGIAWLNHASEEVWLRRTLRSSTYYLTETGVLLTGGLLSAVWTGGAWFALLFLPIYVLTQRAALYEPMRERAEAAARLASANEHLERANAFKSDLMGMLGHELANPLTSVTGYAQAATEALDEEDYASVRRRLHVVERNADRIRDVLHEILTHVASDKEALVAHPEPCLLKPHLLAASAALPHGHRPDVDCNDDLAALVQPVHLDQMLANLISNADKYAGGAVRITARASGDRRVELSVIDGGPGVPATFREQLFDRYSRDSGTVDGVAGSGLGLFITRELARANHGDVTYAEAGPTGSVFTISLPLP